ncbi:MAG: hypothetical protein MJZ03_06715 [archaeon]|nr:hypothetical protein [archaeon]
MNEGAILGFFLRILLTGIFYSVGKKRNIGGGWAATLVFFLGLIGMIIVWCSKKKDKSVEFTDEGNDI